MENKKVMEVLKEKLGDYNTSELEKSVIDIILNECENEPVEYINQVLAYGCVSGCVSALIYCKDTEEFFKNNMDEIFELYNEYKNEVGELDREIDANYLAWFGFEQIAFNLANELGI